MMKCENCEEKQATVHLTEIKDDDEKQEKHLCEDCAQEASMHVPKSFNPAELLTSLISQVAPEIKEMSSTRCDACGLTYLEFRSQGRLGCANDYDAFQKGLVPILKKIHGDAHHQGKTPTRPDAQSTQQGEVVRIRLELEEAVTVEDYERAAELRDRLKELTGS